jgi:two-component system, NarL family, sensor kinase
MTKVILKPLVVFLFFSYTSYAQKIFPDSLEAQLKAASEDTGKVLLQAKLFSFWQRKDMDKAFRFAAGGYELSRKLNYTKGIAKHAGNLGYIYYYRSDFPKALRYYLQAVSYSEKAGDSAALWDAHHFLAKTYFHQDDFDKSLRSTDKMLEIAQSLRSNEKLSSTYNNYGNIYGQRKEYRKALEFYTKKLAVNMKQGHAASISSTYANMAEAYKNLDLHAKSEGFFLKALETARQANMPADDWYFKKFEGGLHMQVADLYVQMGQHRKAIDYVRSGFEKIKGVNAKREETAGYLLLQKAYAGLGRYSEAYRYAQLHAASKDSLFNTEKSKQIAEMQALFETEKKEKEISLLRKEQQINDLVISRQKQQRNLLIGSVIVVIVFAGLFYSRSRLRQKALLASEIAKQEKIRFKAVIEAEEKERKRIAGDLHDGLGQLLSTAKLNVASLEESTPEEDRKLLNNSMALIDEACQEVRNISHNMMPGALIRLGLLPAIKELADKISASGRLKVELESNFNSRLEENTEIALYRVVQEVLNNMIRHAEAEKISLDFRKDKERLHVMIKDNGKGFDTAVMQDSDGLGWKNIYSRVSLLNGELSVRSAPGKGSSVNISLICS